MKCNVFIRQLFNDWPFVKCHFTTFKKKKKWQNILSYFSKSNNKKEQTKMKKTKSQLTEHFEMDTVSFNNYNKFDCLSLLLMHL